VLDLLEGLGYADDPEFAEARSGELQRSCLANAKAQRVLGWRPQTALAEGLRLTLESVRRGRERPDERIPGALQVERASAA
jgi:nucleoside-diphosphate-sugar epimerase